MKQTKVKTAEEARQKAIDWQAWQSEQVMYWSDVIEWADYFRALGEEFNLTEEFEEEGII